MDATQRLDAAELAYHTARRAVTKSAGDRARMKRLETEYKQAMKAWLGVPDDFEGPVAGDPSRHTYKLAICRETLGPACPTYKESTMPPSKPKTPPHTERVYELCDVLDAVAEKSPGAADDYAVLLLGMTTKDWPQHADKVLGKTDADAWRIAYKATTKAPPDPVEQALDRLRQAAQAAGAVAPDDQIVQQIDTLAAALGRLMTPAGQRMEAQMKAERSMGLDPSGMRFDSGQLLGAPVRRAPAVVTTKAPTDDPIGQIARQTAPDLYAKGTKR